MQRNLRGLKVHVRGENGSKQLEVSCPSGVASMLGITELTDVMIVDSCIAQRPSEGAFREAGSTGLRHLSNINDPLNPCREKGGDEVGKR
jgi:hypothetical protein